MKHANILLLGEIFRETVEPRRRQEQRDSKLVGEDRGAIANLSPREMNKHFRIGYQVERLRNEANED